MIIRLWLVVSVLFLALVIPFQALAQTSEPSPTATAIDTPTPFVPVPTATAIDTPTPFVPVPTATAIDTPTPAPTVDLSFLIATLESMQSQSVTDTNRIVESIDGLGRQSISNTIVIIQGLQLLADTDYTHTVLFIDTVATVSALETLRDISNTSRISESFSIVVEGQQAVGNLNFALVVLLVSVLAVSIAGVVVLWVKS